MNWSKNIIPPPKKKRLALSKKSSIEQLTGSCFYKVNNTNITNSPMKTVHYKENQYLLYGTAQLTYMTATQTKLIT